MCIIMRELNMKKIIFRICLTIACVVMVACTTAPVNYGNSPEQQRKNAKESQGELSTDTNGVTR
jgi:hypothetical protein